VILPPARLSAALCALLLTALLLAACGSSAVSPSVTPVPVSPDVVASPSIAAGPGSVEPAPGSDSVVYAPNPAAITVAIDPGHGGCLDWGVPDPSERGEQLAEKTLTLDIARRLRELLEADGVRVVMTRDGDDALAGDDYPQLGCEGPDWRDVNGDGEAGFDPEGHTRTRDELQARLDLANLSRADALVSIHINSPSEGGRRIEVAFTETFYTDETPWGPTGTERLAEHAQRGVVERLGEIATYDRGDRGITAHNFYLVAPPLLEETAERPNRWAQPTRGGLMPVILAEVGSITLREEHDLLASERGQDAVATGLFDGLAAYLGAREAAARIELDGVAGTPEAVPGDGPPFWPEVVPDEPLRLRVTNTGTRAWSDAVLVGGWSTTDEPYLRAAPDALEALVELPDLAPGESITLEIELPAPVGGRAVAWISLRNGSTNLADEGSPALQVSTRAP